MSTSPAISLGLQPLHAVLLATVVIGCLTVALRSQVDPKYEVRQGKAYEALPSTKLPVLIVGAGPAGLTLATVLARYGIPLRIIEKKNRLSRHTKATNLMQRNQEFMFALGLIEKLQNVGGNMHRLMIHAYGKTFGPRTLRLRESPFSDVILCGQHNFEAILADDLLALGVKIEFSTELKHLSQQDDRAIAILAQADREERADFSYVVGCDGRAGTTRKFTCHDFESTKTGVSLRQVDCKLSWRRLASMEQMWMFYFDSGFAVVVPLPGSIYRIITVEPRANVPERDPTLEEIQTKLRAVSKDQTLELSEPDWFSYTDLSMGLASGFRDGRIFLAGDAGNPVLPNGGQGMNTGIADAFNLGWKLAAACGFDGSNALLDTYNEERHAVRSALQKVQFNSLKYTTLVTPRLMQTAFRWFAEPLLNVGGEYKLAEAFSELTIDTRTSALTLDTVKTGGIRAGFRALNAFVVQKTTPIQLYDLIYRGSWTLLGFSGCGAKSSATEVLQAFEALNRPQLSTFVITTESVKGSNSMMLYDLDEEAHRVYGTKSPRIFLVRPDGHVAVRLKLHQTSLLAKYLSQWVPNPSQAFKFRSTPLS